MRAKDLWLGTAVAVAAAVCPAPARAQNNSAATAAQVVVNGGWMNVDMDAGSNTERWYKYPVVAGRSYCVEGISEVAPTAQVGPSVNDGETDVYLGDGTTLMYRNDEDREPGGGSLVAITPGRVCYVAPATEANFARVGNFQFNAVVKSFRWRIVETTLHCPWFFSGNGFEAFILIRNTVREPVAATVTLRSTAGAILGTQTGTVPGNGSLNLLVSAPSPGGFNLPSASGSVEIAYGTPEPLGSPLNATAQGPPGALMANVTSVSFSTGVSFDTPFTPRADWTR